jgi:uncharacterized integral membrane protein
MADAGQSRPPQQRSVSPKLIVGIILAVIALVFIIQNTSKSKVDVFFWDASAPKWIWMIILFGAGVVVGSLFPWFRRRDRARKD